VTPPLKAVVVVPVVPIVSVPTLALVASTIGLAKVRAVVETSSVAGLLPVVLPNVTILVAAPSALDVVVAVTVPARIFRPEVKVFVAESVRPEVRLFSMTPVTSVPMTELMSTPLVPVPWLVIVPVLFTDPVEIVMPLVIVLLLLPLLLLRIRGPVPTTPPPRVKIAVVPLTALLVSVVPPLFTVSAPVTVSAEVAVFSMIPVTLVPMAALMAVVPVPGPKLVTVPVLLIAPVSKVIVPAPPFSKIVKLFVPVTPPLKAVVVVPVVPIVSVPTLALVASTIGLAKVRAVVETSRVAGLLPVVLPSVTTLAAAPSALDVVEAVTVPARIFRPEVKVFVAESVRPEVRLFSVTPVTSVPMTELMITPPIPVPWLVIVPVLFTAVVEIVMPPVELASRVRLWAPVMPPERVQRPVPVEISVLFVLERAKALLMVNGLTPAWVTLVTAEPIVALMVVVPDPVPALVIVPVLFTPPVEIVMPPLELASRIRFCAPVMPPDKVQRPVPLEMSVLFVAERAKGLLMVNGLVPAWVTLVTAEPIVALMVVVPVPVPALVIVPVLFTAVDEIVMPPQE